MSWKRVVMPNKTGSTCTYNGDAKSGMEWRQHSDLLLEQHYKHKNIQALEARENATSSDSAKSTLARLKILNLANIEQSTFKLSPNKTWALELHRDMKNTLTLRLPFKKRKASVKAVAKLLRDTAEKESWFIRAHDRDLKQHTQFGTLGYLPLEVRQVIWDLLLSPIQKSHGPAAYMALMKTSATIANPRMSLARRVADIAYPTTTLTKKAARYRANYWRPYPTSDPSISTILQYYDLTAPLRDLGLASMILRAEIDFYYLSTTSFLFHNASDLAETFQLNYARSLRTITIVLNSRKRSRTSGFVGAFQNVPWNLRSVTVKFGDETGKHFRHHLNTIEVLAKMLGRGTRGGRIVIWRNEWWEGLDGEQRELLREVIGDVER